MRSTSPTAAVLVALLALTALSYAEERPPDASAMSSGNMALLVLADSSKPKEYQLLEQTVLNALRHFGMPMDVLDLSRNALKTEILSSHSAIVLGQSGLGNRLSEGDVRAIQEAIQTGVGLVNFDGMLSSYPAAYRKLVETESAAADRTSSVHISRQSHPITDGYDPDRTYATAQPVAFTSVGPIPHAETLANTEQGLPAVFAARLAKGRIVQFTLAPEFWLRENFGHVHGLDGLFWRSIVWVARKPFVMMAMPPFVTARIDDASGSGSHDLVGPNSAAIRFRYIDAMNRFGYVPNVGLFTDDISDEDGKILKQKADQNLAEFSAHAWTESKYIYIDRVSQSGTARMAEFSAQQLRQGFAKLDQQFARWGVQPSRTLNCHCFNPGLNALPFLKERGQTFLMFPGKFGKDYYDPAAYAWAPKPYGDPGFTVDYMPDDPTFFNVEAHPYTVARDGRITDADIDILWGNVIFRKEASVKQLDAAARRGVEEIRLGLDSLFFGCLMTHEQRIASLTVQEWEQVLGDIDKATSKWERIFKGYDEISRYAKSRYDTKLAAANCDDGSKEIRLKLLGKPELPLKVYLFTGEDLRYQFRELPVFQGQTTAVVR